MRQPLNTVITGSTSGIGLGIAAAFAAGFTPPGAGLLVFLLVFSVVMLSILSQNKNKCKGEKDYISPFAIFLIDPAHSSEDVFTSKHLKAGFFKIHLPPPLFSQR